MFGMATQAPVGLWQGLAVALGVGLLMGVERERHQPEGADALPAGVRSFALVALAGWLAALLGQAVLLVVLAGVAALAVVAYWRSSGSDPGLTSEAALILCGLVGAMASSRPALAAAVGVVATVLLAAKGRLHSLSRSVISEGELRDGLILAAAALVVLPLLPNRTLDPLGLINPAAIWRLVVLIMAIGALGHVALRAMGARIGWPVAGFFSGFVSSTASVVSYAQRSTQTGAAAPAAVAALAANLASLGLLIPVFAAVSPKALAALGWPIAAAMLALCASIGVLAPWRVHDRMLPGAQPAASGRMFNPIRALALALVLSAVVIAAGLLHRWLGTAAALTGAVIAGSAELHSAAAGLGQLHAAQALSDGALRWALAGVLAASAAVKAFLALGAGSAGYFRRVLAGLVAMVAGAVLGSLLAG